MGEWWSGLDSSQRSWFLMFGFLVLFIVAMTVGIVACTNVALMTLMSVGFGAACASAVGAFVTATIRFM